MFTTSHLLPCFPTRLLRVRVRQLRSVGLEHQVARLLALEVLADGVQQLVQVLRHRLLQVLRTQLLLRERVHHLLRAVELLLAAELLGTIHHVGHLHDVEQHHRRERQHAVRLHVARLAEGRADLPLHCLRVVDQVDLAVLVGGTHLLTHQSGNHRVHQVDARLVADLRKVLLCEHEDLALVRAAELRIHVQVLLVQSLQLGVQNAALMASCSVTSDDRRYMSSV